MKRYILSLIAIILIASCLHADASLSLTGGYCTTPQAFAYYGGNPILAINAPTNGQGWFVDLKYGYWYSDWWGIGGKLSCAVISAYDGGLDLMTYANHYKILAGVPLMFRRGIFAFGMGVYAGLGYADVNAWKYYHGAGFVLDTDVELHVFLSPSFSVEINSGYTWAMIDTLYMSNRAEQPGIDLSLIKIGVGINYRFAL